MIKESDVIDAYRFLLDREPDNQQVVEQWMSVPDKGALMRGILGSPEFKRKYRAVSKEPFWSYTASFDAEETIFNHEPRLVRPSSDHFTNFIGVKIRPSFVPEILAGKEGQIEDVPVPANWHADIAEWAACLRALDLAGDHFTMIELGCGWGCWMNILGVAARRTERTFQLYGVEADEKHLEYAKLALADNGIAAENYTLLRGIAGGASGTALFPSIASGVDWGGTALFGLNDQEKAAKLKEGSYVEIPIANIPALVNERVDLLHVDIQGAELSLLTELFEYLNERVCYVMIGTHSREVEAGLLDLFGKSSNWAMEMERGAVHRIIDGRAIVVGDGVQGWRNTALTGRS